jgi:dTDP-4-dehydrorhamnose reductase
MRALIAGAHGQLGRALRATAPAHAIVVAPEKTAFDITDEGAVATVVSHTRPDVVFNAAAYTAVDAAERDEDRARLINATAVGYLAQAARRSRAHLVHVSTDFVFDGRSHRPYHPDDVPAPLSVYGRTKWEGEQAAGRDALVVRTAWVYAAAGRNFVLTMLKLMREKDELKVVADQIGTPTFARSLAVALWSLAQHGAVGVHHYTDSGVASWYDFAVAIQEEGTRVGLIHRAIPVLPVRSDDYPTLATRPAFSVLDKSRTFEVLGGAAPHWRVNLRLMLEEMKTRG